jgi:photosystem II stability/assembly factor-like uncharacterized protein
LHHHQPRPGPLRRLTPPWLTPLCAPFFTPLLAFTLAFPFSLSLHAAEFSEPAPLAAKSLLLGVARAGASLVAVGDHGHIVCSTDNGRTWTQSAVPSRAMLTGVSFPDALHGWAVGHDGVILCSADGGQTWRHQDQGDDLETIYLDVLFLDAQRGFAVGAYGKFISTQDGGKTWQRGAPCDHDIHYNRLTASPGGRLFLAGEGGSLLISSDAGRTWRQSAVPYDGSLFGYVPVDENTGVVHGLRGHILTSTDLGAVWTPHPSEIKALIMGGALLRSGAIVLGGQGGNFFVSRDHGTSFSHWKPRGFDGSVSDLTEADDGALIAVGEAGAVRLALPSP